MSDQTTRSPEQIRRDIEQTREELAETAAALAERADVKARAHEKLDETKARITGKVDEAKAKVAGTAGAAKEKVAGATGSDGGAAGDSTIGATSASTTPTPQERAQALAGQAQRYAQDNPVHAAAIAAFVGGLLIGRIIGRRRAS